MGPEDQTEGQLSLLPPHVQENICKRLDDVSLYHLNNTATYWGPIITGYNNFITKKNKKTVEQTPKLFDNLHRLLSHAAMGEWGGKENQENAEGIEDTAEIEAKETAKTIWLKDSSLLTCPGSVYFPNISVDNVAISPFDNPGRPGYEGLTAYQIALVNAEWDVAEEMRKHMTDEESRAQFMAVFPKGEITCYQWDLDEAKRLLKEVYDAIIDDTVINDTNPDEMSKATREALTKFYKHIEPSKKHHVGTISHPELYTEALGIYDNDETFKKFKSWQHCSFWNRRVEEYIAYGLPSVYLRKHVHGIGRTGGPARDGCVLQGDMSFYWAHRRTTYPGRDFFVGYLGGTELRPWVLAAQSPVPRTLVFENYVKQQRKLGQIMQQNFCRKKSTCLVL